MSTRDRLRGYLTAAGPVRGEHRGHDERRGQRDEDERHAVRRRLRDTADHPRMCESSSGKDQRIAIALLWLAGNALRLTILAVPPVIAMIRDEFQLTATEVGLLRVRRGT